MQRILTDKQKLFVQYFSEKGNATEAAIKAGYSPTTAQQQGYELKNKLAPEIEGATRKLLNSAVPMAIEKLQELIVDPAVNGSTKLGAINSVLDRTGYQTTTKIEDVTGKKSDEELATELKNLLSNIHLQNVREEDVN